MYVPVQGLPLSGLFSLRRQSPLLYICTANFMQISVCAVKFYCCTVNSHSIFQFAQFMYLHTMTIYHNVDFCSNLVSLCTVVVSLHALINNIFFYVFQSVIRFAWQNVFFSPEGLSPSGEQFVARHQTNLALFTTELTQDQLG